MVKSISRKDKDFAGAVRYADKKQSRDFSGIFYPSEEWSERWDKGFCQDSVIEKFESNAENCPLRKNGVYFYHDIISFSHLDRERLTSDIMEDLALKYVELRAGQALVYGKLHMDTECPHIHLIISANVLGKSSKIRLSKKKFDGVKRELEACQREKYPFLSHSLVFDREKRRKNSLPLKRQEREREQRLRREGNKKNSEKDKVYRLVHDCLSLATSEIEFKEKLRSAGLEFYRRGENTVGVQRLDDKRKYRKFRLKTLGLGKMWEKTFDYWQKKPEMEKRMENIESDRLRRLVAEMGFKRDVTDLLEVGDSELRKDLSQALRANRELEREQILARELGF